jgi:hypothetical protein
LLIEEKTKLTYRTISRLVGYGIMDMFVRVSSSMVAMFAAKELGLGVVVEMVGEEAHDERSYEARLEMFSSTRLLSLRLAP